MFEHESRKFYGSECHENLHRIDGVINTIKNKSEVLLTELNSDEVDVSLKIKLISIIFI